MSALDYKFLECVKHMPPLGHAKDKTGFDIQNSDVAKWIVQQPEWQERWDLTTSTWT